MHDWGFGMGFGWIVPLLFVFALFYITDLTHHIIN